MTSMDEYCTCKHSGTQHKPLIELRKRRHNIDLDWKATCWGIKANGLPCNCLVLSKGARWVWPPYERKLQGRPRGPYSKLQP